MSCPPNAVKLYKKLGFAHMAGKSMDCSDCEDGDLYLECRCKKSNSGSGTMAKPGRVNSAAPSGGTSRTELVRQLFVLFDADGDGFLNQKEMYGFALQTGFDGTEMEWSAEFQALCADSGANALVGLDEAKLRQLVDDPSDAGCHCTDDELQKMVRDLAAAKPPATAPAKSSLSQPDLRPSQPGLDTERQQLVQEVFHFCDRDSDGRLKKDEMLRFAELTGFEGNGQEWDEEYRLLCADHDLDTNLGIAEDTFLRLVDDESDAGQYCSDDELREMLEKLRLEPRDKFLDDKVGDIKPNRAVAAAPPGLSLDNPSNAVTKALDCNEDMQLEQRLEASEFHVDVSLQDTKMQTLLSHAQTVAALTYRRNLISQANTHKGYRITLLAEKGKHVKPVLGYAVYFFTPHNVLNVLQVGAVEQHCSVLRRMAQWLLQHAQNTGAELVAISCPPSVTKTYLEVGFTQMNGFMDCPDCDDSDLYLECRCKPNIGNGGLMTQSGLTGATNDGRAELVHTLFQRLDKDGDGFLNAEEMYGFALRTGFDGPKDEWAVEFRALCADSGVDASVGPNEETLRRLVDDPSDAGCHCTDEELQEMVQSLAAATPPVTAPPGLTMTQTDFAPAPQPAPPLKTGADNLRRSLVDEVFRLCDRDADGRLKRHEMLCFAELTGFEGQEQEWDEEYRLLCDDHGFDAYLGIGKDDFARLVDDASDAGQYCSDDELKEMLENLRSEQIQRPPPEDPVPGNGQRAALSSTAPTPAPTPVAVGMLRPSQQVEAPTTAPASWLQTDIPPAPVESSLERNANNSVGAGPEAAAMAPGVSRDYLIDAVFRALDEDEDGRLSGKEMRVFAGRIGFDGSDEEWCGEFSAICPDAKGVSPELFKKLANDTTDEGCYCTTDELRTILKDLFPKMRARRERTAAAEAAAPAAATAEAARASSASQQRSLAAASAATLQRSRSELVRHIFEVCDSDGDKFLNVREMRRFADAIGFEGEDLEWEVEFAALFDGRSERPNAGVSLQFFSELVDDMSESGCYCTDEELSDMYAKFLR